MARFLNKWSRPVREPKRGVFARSGTELWFFAEGEQPKRVWLKEPPETEDEAEEIVNRFNRDTFLPRNRWLGPLDPPGEKEPGA